MYVSSYQTERNKFLMMNWMLNNVEILKCTYKRIKDRLRAYYEKIWKAMSVSNKSNKALVYRKHKTNLKWNDI